MSVNVAIVGHPVGQEFLTVLAERKFPIRISSCWPRAQCRQDRSTIAAKPTPSRN